MRTSPPVEVWRFFSTIVAAGDDVRNPYQEDIAHSAEMDCWLRKKMTAYLCVDYPSLYFYFVNHRYGGKGHDDDKVLDRSANRFQQ